MIITDRARRLPKLVKLGMVVVLAVVSVVMLVAVTRPDDQTYMPSIDHAGEGGPSSPVAGAKVEIEPASAPLGMLLTFEGRGLQALFEGQGSYGRPIYLVRHDPARDADLVARLRRGRVTEKGTLHEQAWVPEELEVRKPGGVAPWEKVPATPGVYEFAIDTPANRVPGSAFELVPARVGVPYDRVLTTHCGIERFGFDGSTWLADPPLSDGQGNPPPGWGNPGAEGTFTLTAQDRAVFRATNGQVAKFRRAPADAVLEPRDCA